MGRSGYTDDCCGWELIMWRGAVKSAIRGKRGQALLHEMRDALDAMPVKELIADQFEDGEKVCALGAVGKRRGIEMKGIDPYDRDSVARTFGIAPALAAEIAYINDDGYSYSQTPAQRWKRVREWVESQITQPTAPEEARDGN